MPREDRPKREVDPARCARATFLETEIRELMDLADDALEANQPGAAVAAKRAAADLRTELDKLRAYERDRRKKRSPLEEVRAMRLRADAAGSHVAARDLMKMEIDLLAKEEEEERAERERRLAGLAENEVLMMLVEELLKLPPELKRAVQEAVFPAVVH